MKKECIDAIKQFGDNLERFAIVTITESGGSAPSSLGQNLIVGESGLVVGTVGGGLVESKIMDLAKESLKMGVSQSFSYNLLEIGMSCGGNVKGFIQAPPVDNHIVVVGGGHIAQKLYAIGKNLNFKLTIIDDRIEYANSEIFSECEVICCDYDEILSKVNINENTYVVIVTRGHDTDLKALRQIITMPTKYTGMIGSKRKILEIKKQLLEEYRDNEDLANELFNSIYAPIGLNIAKNDPSEIAISIYAEILAIKNNGKLEHLKLN